eukprot:1840020-Amphidinium_carterae.1
MTASASVARLYVWHLAMTSCEKTVEHVKCGLQKAQQLTRKSVWKTAELKVFEGMLDNKTRKHTTQNNQLKL